METISNHNNDGMEMSPAFRNEYILEHLFNFLDFSDIKSCRLVNQMWHDVGGRVIRRQPFAIVLDLNRIEGKCTKSTKFKVKEFVQFYGSLAENRESNLPRLKFRGKILSQVADPYLKSSGIYIKDLRLFHAIITYASKRGRFFEVPLELISNQRKLTMLRHYCIKAKLIGKLNLLDPSRRVLLLYCRIILNEREKRISLKKVSSEEFHNYLQNGVKLQEFDIQDIFDPRSNQELHAAGVNLVLDFVTITLTMCQHDAKDLGIDLEDCTILSENVNNNNGNANANLYSAVQQGFKCSPCSIV